MHSRCRSLSLCLIGFFTLAPPVFGGDISSDIRRGQFTGDGGFFEIGGSAIAATSPIVGVPEEDQGNTAISGALTVTGRYQKGPAFAEITSFDSINLGLNLWNNDQWFFDALITQRHGDLDPQDIDALENSNLRKRSADIPVGLRATGYLGKTLVQITVLSGDLRDNHSGYTFGAEVGHAWQIRNYNLHWIVGACFESEHVTKYYYGVDDEQANAEFPTYQAADSMRLVTELGLTLALSEHWVVSGQARYTYFSNAIQDSPFIEDDYGTLAALTLSYVF